MVLNDIPINADHISEMPGYLTYAHLSPVYPYRDCFMLKYAWGGAF